MPFIDANTLEENSTNDGCSENQQEDSFDKNIISKEDEAIEDKEDSVLDLDDFTGLKKKKKKKETFQL